MNRDEKQFLAFYGYWMALMLLTGKIGGGIGLTLFICGTALMLLYAWADHRQEQLIKEQRRKVKEGAQRIEKAYKDGERDV